MYRIYRLIDPDTKEIRYIGYTKYTLEKRLSYHLKEAIAPSSRPTHKNNWIKYLLKNNKLPVIELIEETKNYVEREIFWIAEYKSKGLNLTNGTIGGDGRKGPLPESAKRKLSEINKGKSPSLEARLKISKALKGRKLTEEHKNKLKQKRSDITRVKISNAKKGIPVSAQVKEKVSNTLKGKIFPGQLDQLAEARKNRKLKPVQQYTLDGQFINEYSWAKEAERRTQIKAGLIRDACSGIQKTAGGFIWKYKI